MRVAVLVPRPRLVDGQPRTRRQDELRRGRGARAVVAYLQDVNVEVLPGDDHLVLGARLRVAREQERRRAAVHADDERVVVDVAAEAGRREEGEGDAAQRERVADLADVPRRT